LPFTSKEAHIIDISLLGFANIREKELLNESQWLSNMKDISNKAWIFKNLFHFRCISIDVPLLAKESMLKKLSKKFVKFTGLFRMEEF
jgi:hypothetical protein